MTLFGKILLLAIVVFFGLAIYFNRKKNIKSSVVSTSKLSIADLFKIDSIAKRFFCQFSTSVDREKGLAIVEFFGDKRRYVAADELDCYFNRRFTKDSSYVAHERHRV